MKKIILMFFVFCVSKNLLAQNVGIGTVTPNASAMLDVSATNKGVLVPRVALINASDVATIVTPPLSLLIYNTATAGVPSLAVSPGYYYWNGSKWVALIVSDNSLKAAWQLGGNGGTSPANNYMGTIDNQPLRFKITDTDAGYLGLDGNTYWGFNSGNIANTGYSNVAIGSSALNFTGSRSNIVAVGDSALFTNGRGTSVATDAINNTAVGSKALLTNNAGSYNTALGFNALMLNATGISNTATGNEALRNNSTGIQNTANGKASLFFNTSGSFNSAGGAGSLGNNTTGNANTAAGTNALLNNTNGYSNVAVGINALRLNTTKSNLVAMGDSALLNNGTGASVAIDATANTAIGSKALYANTIGNNNTASGQNSLTNNTTGNSNTAAGANALLNNTTGNNNTANGQISLTNNNTGNNNTSTGAGSLLSNTTGFSNTAVGMNALNKNTSRSNLVAVGDSALYNNGINTATTTEATGNTAIGSKALFTNTKGFYNTALGLKTLYSNTSGNYNTASGVQSLFSDTSGSYNTSMGYQSLTNNTNGNNNTASGFQSLLSNTTGTNNTANGASSLTLTNTGTNNTANGYLSLFGNTTGNNNTAAGASSLISNTTGYSNVGVGINALNSNITGSNLVAVGDSALYNNGTGATAAQGKENTAIGSKALITNTIGNNNTAVGSNADMAANNLNNATAVGNKSFVNCSNCMVLGSINGLNGAASSVKVGIGTPTPLMGLHVAKTDSAVALLENTQTLNTNVSNALYFKTGSGILSYTGAVKTIGETTGSARLGLFTSTAFNANGLLERVSITDNGNTGIGTTLPLMNLHVSSADSAVALLENTQFLNTNVSNALYFKTGTGSLPYTGAVKTIGESTGTARLGFFTFASASANALKERMSVTDAGNVGIGIVAPQTDLHINPGGAGSLLIGANKFTGLFTNLEMGITAQSNGYGYIQSTKASGSSFGTLAINESGGGVGIGTSQVNSLAKLTVGVNTGVGGSYSGIVATGNGSNTNSAIKAIGTNNADALVIDGPIRALANNGRVIYRMTTQITTPNTDGYLLSTLTGVSGAPDGVVTVLIDNPLCNGDPNAIIFYSMISGYIPGNKNYLSYLLYNNASQKWSIKYFFDVYSSASVVNGLELNIMIVK